MLQPENTCLVGEYYFDQEHVCLALSTRRNGVTKTDSISMQLASGLKHFLENIFVNFQRNFRVTDTNGHRVVFEHFGNSPGKRRFFTNYFLHTNNALLARLPFTCASGFFICKRSSEQCIAPQFVCDSVIDCPNGEDEDNCACEKTLFSNMNCVNTTDQHFLKDANVYFSLDKALPLVIQKRAKNISKEQCILGHPLGFDFHERCLFDRTKDGKPGLCPFEILLKNCQELNCTNSFKCSRSYCVPYRNVCDGKWDCPEGDDEKITCKNLTCPGFFHCKSFSTCLHPSEICDGKIDCSSVFKDDEIMCIKHYSCTPECECLGAVMDCKNKNFSILPPVSHVNTEFLFFSFNHLSVLSDGCFHSFSNLRHLNLSHNNISEISVKAFSKEMLHFDTIDLRSNRMKSLQKQQFMGLKESSTKHLFLTSNELDEVHEWVFSGLKHLAELNLCCMSISILKEYSFADIPRLQYLNLSNNEIAELRVNLIDNTTALAILDVSRNSILCISTQLLVDLTMIDVLVTSSSHLCCLLSQLENLCVDHTRNQHYDCSNTGQTVKITLRVFLAVSCFCSSFSLLYHLLSHHSAEAVPFILPGIFGVLLVLNILLIDFNKKFSLTSLLFYTTHGVRICNVTRLATNVAHFVVFLNPVVNSLDTFVLIFVPFRRKGVSVRHKLQIFAIVTVSSMCLSPISLLLEKSGYVLSHGDTAYTTCVPLLVGSALQKYTNLTFLGLGNLLLVSLKTSIAFNLLCMGAPGRKQTKIKREFGVCSITQAIAFSLFWWPILVILAIQPKRELVIILSNTVFLLALVITILDNIFFTFARMDFRVAVWVCRRGKCLKQNKE